MIADTTILIDFLIGKKEAIAQFEQVNICTTSISVFEVVQGLSESEKELFTEFLQNIKVLSFQCEDAVVAGSIYAELKSQGKEIDPEDCMIAAIALRHEVAILTRNVNHFSRISNLRVKSY
ncbi:MAG: PIN domain-containing protein [Candidatus Woesearchaeota archaeon]